MGVLALAVALTDRAVLVLEDVGSAGDGVSVSRAVVQMTIAHESPWIVSECEPCIGVTMQQQTHTHNEGALLASGQCRPHSGRPDHVFTSATPNPVAAPSGVVKRTDAFQRRQNEESSMIVLGLILLLLGYFLGISILYTVGGILLVIGLVLWIAGAMGRGVGGRSHYW
jgi:hypothetical protein